MPGVISTVTTRSGKASTAADASTFFVAGITERGPTDSLGELRSIADYLTLYGARVTYGTIFDHLRVFFEEGGQVAKVIRVVGPAAVAGTVTLQDSVPAASLTLTAVGAGDWSSSLSVTVAAGTLPSTKRITLAYGETTEVFDNLASATAAAQAINARSVLVTAADEGGGLPADGSFSLAGGDDDRAAITTANYITALSTYADERTGPGAVAVPGQAAATIGADLLSYAKANRKTALLASTANADVATAKSDAAGLLDTDGAEYGGLFYPWVTINENGVLLDIGPEGYVAGVRARTFGRVGPWRAPAGEIATARSIVGPTTEIDQTAGNDLDAGNVSAIRTIYGAPRLYGWRSLSSDTENYALLTGAEVVNFVLDRASRALEEFVFESIDARGQLFAAVNGSLVGILQPIADAGGLYARVVNGEVRDPGYAVTADETVNTPAVIASNTLRADVALRVAPTASLITFNLTKVAVTATI